ncbi:MAG: RsmB/NOP family class I SAM-dependent RNA methyltransferase [Amylibacter sp.]|nr:RsmB/NOP family class I SAM-dependent RNA methyltransferase [Amylibacter sp.]
MAKPGLSARIAALNLLNGVLTDKRPMSEMTDAGSDILRKLSGSERARAQSLTLSTLRYLEPIDVLLDFYLKKEPPLRVRNILRLCAAELLVDGISPHAAIDSAVSITKLGRKTVHIAGLVNAVCRKLDGEGREHWQEHPTQELPYYLRSIMLNDHGADAVALIEEAHVRAVPLDITVKRDEDMAELADLLEAEVIGDKALRLQRAGQVSALAGFEEGAWWVQDFAASLPAKCLAGIEDAKVLDLCAAPGGKTLQLAAMGGHVTAMDLSKHRLVRLHENLSRTGLAAKVVTADVLTWKPGVEYDAILLDAPCTATGTIRRHPDLPHLKDKAAVISLVALQKEMLERAFEWLKPGGQMIYSTCSLLKREGEEQIAEFLAGNDKAAIEPIDADALGVPHEWLTPEGYLRTLPSYWPENGGMDGFFIAKLVKTK